MMKTSPRCPKSGKTHKGECMMGTDVCYKCCKAGHFARDCRGREVLPQGQAAPRGQVAPNAQGGQGQAKGGQASKNNRFYALHGCQEYEDVPDIVTGTLRVFHFDVYVMSRQFRLILGLKSPIYCPQCLDYA